MGVKGLTKLLQEENLLPRDVCGNESRCLWRSDGFDLGDRMERIPPDSILAIDGNGLAFHLHTIAYARYFDDITRKVSSVINNGRKIKSEGCICRAKSLTEHQATALLPSCLPLHLLEDLTKEFVDALKNNGISLQVFWDGPVRRLKSHTTRSRHAARDSEWDSLKQYCQHGVIPPASKSHCYKDLLRNFPYSTLFLDQMRYTLRQCDVEMLTCEEEADVELARRSARNPLTFCVGNDSDFCLFRGSKYIPLNTLNVSGSTVMGIIITRSQLADHLDLPDERALVELAILMGNDYVLADSARLDGSVSCRDGRDKVRHIQDSGPGYAVSSPLPDMQIAMDFTRDLYELNDLSGYPIDDKSTERDSTGPTSQGSKPKIPAELDLSLTRLQRLDLSLRDVVLRPLKAYVEQVETTGLPTTPVILPEHLAALQKIASHEKLTLDMHTCTRAEWVDVVAAYVIEQILRRVIRSYPDAPAVRLSSPSKLFDYSKFHSLLRTYRVENGIISESHHDGAGEEEPSDTDDAPTELPIDEHEEAILKAVKTQRVCIIHGETGCGKSSRVPVMLLNAPPPDPSFPSVKLFISQPRRIAAKSLVDRVRSCEPKLRDSIALRMGHGVREYETRHTRAWFVTTGYLVRLLANNPQKFDDCSYLIIDEVHERSVDTDILCLLCRRLLTSNPRIRLILMSATLAAALYQQYFGVPEKPIHVGVKRFPIQEYFVEDLISDFSLPPKEKRAATAVKKECDRLSCSGAPSKSYMEQVYALAAHVTMAVGRPGSSVLIFVPGMGDIISISDLIEKLYVPGVWFSCFPIHGDIPFEEQLAAFTSPNTDEVKVIIATNAAESSVTLKAVDHVICLGLCNQIVYNASSHRQMLQPCWISQASAIQRAGRTGRVRKGNVYRLYTRTAMEEYMDKFEPGEMLRIPLDSVILNLKCMLKEEVKPVLLQCIEPPDLSAIDRSFQSLCNSKFISNPDDSGEITSLGSFVVALGIDLSLGSLIGLGIQFGVGAEAIEMAAVMSFPKTPWIMTNPLYHEAPEYNDITARTFTSRCHFDARLYSEPLSVMNLLWDYEHASNKNAWCWHFSASVQRLRRLAATKNNLRSRVADFLGIDAELLAVENPPVRMHHAKVTILRILQVWVFSDSIIQCSPCRSGAIEKPVTLTLGGMPVEERHLGQILDSERHPFTLTQRREIIQRGSFSPVGVEESGLDFKIFLDDFESRFVSFSLENKFDLFWYQTDDSICIFATESTTKSKGFKAVADKVLESLNPVRVICERSNSSGRRGRKGRPCGLWSISGEATLIEMTPEKEIVSVMMWSTSTANVKRSRLLNRECFDIPSVDKVLSCSMSKSSKKKKKLTSLGFTLTSRGICSEITKKDIGDIFATPNIDVTTHESSKFPQIICFPETPNMPLRDFGSNSRSHRSTADVCEHSSWTRPLMDDIPEGARLLSVLASGRRKDHIIRLSSFTSFDDEEGNEADQLSEPDVEHAPLDVYLSKEDTRICQRWRRLGTDRHVFISENSVPAAAVPSQGSSELFACCSNILELRGGAVRVEGVTLLPPGRVFLLLSFLTFGLQPFASEGVPEEKKEQEDQEDPFELECLTWLKQDSLSFDQFAMGKDEIAAEDDEKSKALARIQPSRDFHKSCETLGEHLECQPEKVRGLCKIFEAIDGYSVVPWDDLDENSLVASNLVRCRSTRGKGNSCRTAQIKQSITSGTEMQADSNGREEGETPRGIPSDQAVENNIVLQAVVMEKQLEESYSRLFCTHPLRGERIGEWDLPSTRHMSLVFQQYAFAAQQHVPGSRSKRDTGTEINRERKTLMNHHASILLDEEHWNIYSVRDEHGKVWYFADFINTLIPTSMPWHDNNTSPSWISQGFGRPIHSSDALDCVPPQFRTISILGAQVVFPTKKTHALLFQSPDVALKMESAFWLDHYFGEPNRHWYQQEISELLQKATFC